MAFLMIFLSVVYFGADNANKALASISDQISKVVTICSSPAGFWSLANSLVAKTADDSVETPL